MALVLASLAGTVATLVVLVVLSLTLNAPPRRSLGEGAMLGIGYAVWVVAALAISAIWLRRSK